MAAIERIVTRGRKPETFAATIDPRLASVCLRRAIEEILTGGARAAPDGDEDVARAEETWSRSSARPNGTRELTGAEAERQSVSPLK
jgi:hypothetical protein